MNRRACAAHRQCRSEVRVRTWNAPAVCARPVRAMHRNLRRVSCGAYRQRSSDVHEQLELLHDLRAEDVVERGEHSEGERRGSYATASARSCPARATGLRVRMREGAQHGGRVTKHLLHFRYRCCTMHVAGSGEGGKWRKRISQTRLVQGKYATHVATRLLSPIRTRKAGHAPAPRVARECRKDAPLAPPRHEGTGGGAKPMPRGQGSPRERRACAKPMPRGQGLRASGDGATPIGCREGRSDAVTARARVVQRRCHLGRG